tara:strand:- start:641 stop:1603 length:963 start_codon:yes stop_codon:yes gene_type:complete
MAFGFICILFGFFFGSFEISLKKFFLGNLSQLEKEILYEIRIPRVLLSAIVGAALGLAGASLQGLFRNPLADPGLIGVSAGAALGAVLSIVIFSNLIENTFFGIYLLPISSVAGAFVVIFILYSLSKGFIYDGVTYMLLIGIAINALASVGIGVLTFVSDDAQLRGLTFWMMGSLANAQWNLVIPSIFIILLSIFWIIPQSRKIDIIQIGEIEASRLGINVKKLKFIVIMSSALMVGVSVSISGMIGFIGLVIPHLVRLIGGVNHNYLLIGSAFLGASLLILSDIISRIVIQPAELPVGLVTSAIGSPFFLWLVLRIKNS